MNGFDLRLWRRGFLWDQERAAREIGVCIRTYKTYENKTNKLPVLVQLATSGVSLRHLHEHVAPLVAAEEISVAELFRLMGTVKP